MPATVDEDVTLTFPRATVREVISLSQSLTDRLHELLERNTDGALSPIEHEELETLVRMAQFGQILSLALMAPAKP